MSFGFLGIQFGWGLQMSNMSAIYEYLHARPEQIPLLGLAAPLTGLIIQPVDGGGNAVILDASINVTMEPFCTFVADLLPDEQRTRGFAMQIIFIALGPVAASAMPYLLSHLFDLS